MAGYELLVDGERRRKAGSEDDVRAWLRDYRAEHAEDDPDAVHVQVRRLSPWSWLTGGRLVDRRRFLADEPPPTQSGVAAAGARGWIVTFGDETLFRAVAPDGYAPG